MVDSTQEFIYLRPVFIAVIIFLFALLVISFSGNRMKLMNRFSFFFILFICISLSSILLISGGYIADTYGLDGDTASSYMWLAIVGLSFVNIFVFFRRRKSKT